MDRKAALPKRVKKTRIGGTQKVSHFAPRKANM